MCNNKNADKCQPPYSEYGLLLQLKGKVEDCHQSIARRAAYLVKRLPQFQSIDTNSDHILFNLSLSHATCLSLNAFTEETVVSKGGTLHRYSIYDILSRFNHSCDANVNHYIDDAYITHCIASRAIEQGHQLFINYFGGDFEGTDEERRRCLEDIWHFKCYCSKCKKIVI